MKIFQSSRTMSETIVTNEQEISHIEAGPWDIAFYKEGHQKSHNAHTKGSK